ncbi:MAG TPA: AAA family ATPase [Methylomirabilota bacterium]|nr:AAA family ATPase [Methylomirabilota bacterium]
MGQPISKTLYNTVLSLAIEKLHIERTYVQMTEQLRDIMRKPRKTIEYLVEDILVRNTYTALVGPPKIGKSFLTENIIIAVARGHNALGYLATVQCPILWLSVEDKELRIQNRIGRMINPRLTLPYTIEVEYHWRPFDQGGLGALEDWSKIHPGGLIVIDPVTAILPTGSGSKSLYRNEYEASLTLTKLAIDYEVTILGVSHSNKGKHENAWDEISGSTGVSAGMENVLIMRRTTNKHEVKLFVDGRDIADPRTHLLSFDVTTLTWKYEGEYHKTFQAEKQVEIYNLLKTIKGGLTIKNIAKKLQRNLYSTRILVSRMKEKGELEMQAGYKYVALEKTPPPLQKHELKVIKRDLSGEENTSEEQSP